MLEGEGLTCVATPTRNNLSVSTFVTVLFIPLRYIQVVLSCELTNGDQVKVGQVDRINQLIIVNPISRQCTGIMVRHVHSL